MLGAHVGGAQWLRFLSSAWSRRWWYAGALSSFRLLGVQGGVGVALVLAVSAYVSLAFSAALVLAVSAYVSLAFSSSRFCLRFSSFFVHGRT